MAKLKMKTVRIIALRKSRKRLLEHLQDSGLIHVRHIEECEQGFSRKDTSPQLRQFERNYSLTQQALKILDKTSPEKKGMLASFRGRREIEPEELGRIASGSARILGICSRIVELDKLRADCAAEKIRTKTALAQLEPWKELDVPLNTRDTASTAIFIGSFPRMYDSIALSEALAQADAKLIFDSEILFSSSSLTCVVIYTPLRQKENAEMILRSMGFTQPLNPSSHTPAEKSKRLLKRIDDLQEKSDNAAEELEKLLKYRGDIRDTGDYLGVRTEKYKVISELDQTNNVFILNGYVPEEDCEALQALCERVAPCVVEFGDADENAPVKLKNNAFNEPAESIVTMYSPPSHDDIDPTPVLAFFFYFFFGMMFSDAGYGLLMIIATAIVIKVFKPDHKMRSNLKLFQYCGIFTVLWGLIFGSIFGDAPAVIYKLVTGNDITMAQLLPWPILDTQKDALMIMILSIGLGLVHILVGMGCKFWICLKKKDYAGAFFDTGLWMTMLTGFAVLGAGMAFGGILVTIGAGIAIASAAGLVLTQGRGKKGVFGKLIGGLASLYDVTSYISDLLSYSRLLALGLTTGVMAQVFNKLSILMGTSVFGIIYMIAVFVIGHAITIGLNALGSYVHTMRLQYVEMFSKFYEGGGKPFEPFAVNSTGFKIKNKNDN